MDPFLYRSNRCSTIIIILGFVIQAVISSKVSGQGNERATRIVYPGSAEDSIGGIAAVINASGVTSDEKISEINHWITTNIRYDRTRQSIVETPELLKILVDEVITSRKAICQGYCAVFHELCNRCGIRSFIIHGLVKREGMIQQVPHAWMAAEINGKWQLFDPTWGAVGSKEDGLYTSADQVYFRIDPQVHIRTCYPFDPLWQLLESPWRLEEFISGVKRMNGDARFSFTDSINTYFSADEETRLEMKLRRVAAFSGNSEFTSGYLDFLASTLKIRRMNNDVIRKNQNIDSCNRVVNLYNFAAQAFNNYNMAKSTRFSNPELEDRMISELVMRADSLLREGESELAALTPADPENYEFISNLRLKLLALRASVNVELDFVELYLKTEKVDRPKLFTSRSEKR